MSKSKLRSDKTCLNCRHVVEKTFCPNCGQENSDSRKTFHQLFIHFFEDLTHYENAFWKTIRNLLFKPGSLTKEYLSGKRLSYLAPVRLYIFISFITFFLLATLLVPDVPERSALATSENKLQPDSVKAHNAKIDKLLVSGEITNHEAEKLQQYYLERDTLLIETLDLDYKSTAELDYQYKHNTGAEKIDDVEYWFMSRLVRVAENNTKSEMLHKFGAAMFHNFPKVLFIYMPLFAFFLWLFHNKKRWYYFDHGIFTLHYFSFLLLLSLLMELLTWINTITGEFIILDALDSFATLVGTIWMIYYFFPAHHRFYGGSRTKSIVKGILLLFINGFFASIIMLAFLLYTIFTLK